MLNRVTSKPVRVAAFDGPLRGDLALIGRYRTAERLLTRLLQPSIGKPGQSSAPVARLLNDHTNSCAKIVLGSNQLAEAIHKHAIHAKAIVEAFPNSFLGLLIEEPKSLKTKRKNRSDVYFEHLTDTGGLDALLAHFLPGRQLAASLNTVKNHDDRAAFVCALTALCVAAGDYTAVGDEDGWIVLPPRALIRPWAWKLLVQNAEDSGGLEWQPR